MSAVQNCLNRYLLFPNICGSFIFNSHGELQKIRVIRIIVSVGAFVYTIIHQPASPIYDFMFFVMFIENCLICFAALILLRASCLVKYFRKSLELMESVSDYVNGSEIKLIIWPSIFSNAILIVINLYRTYKFSIPLLDTFSHLQILLLLNAFTDEFSTILHLLKFLSEALNTHLSTISDRENLISLLKAHNMLCSAIGHINKLYTVQILFVISLSCFCCITFTYLLILESMLAHIDSISVFMWVIAFLQLSVKMILSASSLTNSIQSFDVQLYEILKARPPSWTPLVKVEDFIFDRTVRLSAGGCFDLTIENLGSMISVSTTYLVLLMQMN